jgi:hypothetical protein
LMARDAGDESGSFADPVGVARRAKAPHYQPRAHSLSLSLSLSLYRIRPEQAPRIPAFLRTAHLPILSPFTHPKRQRPLKTRRKNTRKNTSTMAEPQQQRPPAAEAAAAAASTATSVSVYDELFDAADRGKDGALDFGDVVVLLKRMSPDQSLASARNAAVEALLLIGRGEAALAPPTRATVGARRLSRGDFRLLLERVAAMAGVDPVEAAGKLLAQARRSSFCLAVGGLAEEAEMGGGDEEEQDDASVAREVAAVDRTDSRLAGGAREGEVCRVLPSEEATAAAAAAVAATVAGGGAGGGTTSGGEGGAASAAGGGGAAGGPALFPPLPPTAAAAAAAAASRRPSKSPGRKALALATDPQLGVLFSAWCGGGRGGGGGGNGGAAAAASSSSAPPPTLKMSLADLAQGLCRLRPPKSKDDVAAALSEAARAMARHDGDGDGLLSRAEFASFVASLLSAAGVAWGDASTAMVEAAQARPASEAMRRTLDEHGDLIEAVYCSGVGGRRGGGD